MKRKPYGPSVPNVDAGSRFGELLRMWRLENGLTLDAMAERLGCSRQRAHQYEVMRIGPSGAVCRKITAEKICEAIEVSGDEREKMVQGISENPFHKRPKNRVRSRIIVTRRNNHE